MSWKIQERASGQVVTKEEEYASSGEAETAAFHLICRKNHLGTGKIDIYISDGRRWKRYAFYSRGCSIRACLVMFKESITSFVVKLPDGSNVSIIATTFGKPKRGDRVLIIEDDEDRILVPHPQQYA